VLVTLGGSDPDNVTLRVIEGLIATPEFEAQIVAGGSNPHLARLREAFGESNGALRLVHDPGDMAELMAWADVAVSAAGTAAWEMAFMGLPALLIVLADNQEPIASALVDAGAALSLGPATTFGAEHICDRLRSLAASHEVLRKMSARGRALIDGRGSERVVAAMLERDVALRSAEQMSCGGKLL
jgi:spore coat polysaccharide biosynthesis predicted glycosyltransferase SpsG